MGGVFRSLRYAYKRIKIPEGIGAQTATIGTHTHAELNLTAAVGSFAISTELHYDRHAWLLLHSGVMASGAPVGRQQRRPLFHVLGTLVLGSV
jgi:hypothetical protein